MIVKEGEKWVATDGTVFRVLSVAHQEGNIWVYYRNEVSGQEYSCWEDSFVSRFVLVVN